MNLDIYVNALVDRLERARDELDKMAKRAHMSERLRLKGKAQGVRLALSYVRELSPDRSGLAYEPCVCPRPYRPDNVANHCVHHGEGGK